MRALAAAALLCLAAAGCSPGSGGGSPSPTPTSAEAPTSLPKVPAEEFRTQFTPRPDIVRAHDIPIESWTKVDANTIALNFTAGTPECYGVDPVVTETDTTVEVSLRMGTLPEAADRMCILIAVMGSVEVPLAAPIGDRTVVGS